MFRNRKNQSRRRPKRSVKGGVCAVLTAALCMSSLSVGNLAFASTVDETSEGATVDSYSQDSVEESLSTQDLEPSYSTEFEQNEQTEADPDTEVDLSIESESALEPEDETAQETTDEDALTEEVPEEEDLEYEIMPLAVSGAAGISSFSVSAQVDGTAPWDGDNEPGNDMDDSNDIVRTFDYVNYTLSYTTELSDPTATVDSGNVYVEFTLPCGPDVASFNMNTLNWMSNPEVTYYLSDGTETTEYKNGDEVVKQVLTGYRELVNTSDNTAIPGTGTLSVGIYIGAAKNGTTLTPEFTAWMDNNADEDKVTVENVNELTISAAQKYNIGIRQSSEMNIAGTYDLSTGNENAAKDTISNNTSVRGRMEGYGVTVMMQNDSLDKGLKGLEFPTDTITFDLTLSEQAENRSGTDLSSTAGYTPVIWDYDANLRKTAANGGSVGQWDRTWVYTNAANMDCAYGAAPFNKLGCHTYSTIYDSCYDGGTWHMEQDGSNPLVYHVTISDYTIDYENYHFPTANNTWYARTSAGTVYTANQACLSAGTTQMVLQFPASAVDAPTYIYYKMTADNFKVGDVPYNAEATYTNTYQLVPEGSIQSGVNFTDDTATSRAASGHQLGSGYMEGDAYSFLGTNVRLWGYQSTTTDEYVRTKATLIKFDADAFEINKDDQYYANGRYAHGSGSGAVHSFTRYFAGRSSNWTDTQEMSDTLINSTDLHYYTSLDDLESAGYTCVGELYIADVEDINSSSQSVGMIGLTVKDDSALIGNVYAACNDSWASYSTLEELEEKFGAPISGEGGTINTDWARNGYNLYKAYCSLDVYKTMKDTIESGNNGDYWYHKTEYDSDGNITGGHDVGYYGGTSLLICGEKSTVEISTDRTVYDMDTGQRTAVVTVTPSVTVEGNASSETGDKGTTTTTATVKVTLPSDLTYDTGTAYWGDTAITPTVTTNDDGSTVLTFVLEDVTLGETLDAIIFNCTIGHAGTADDVTNNESISLNATIESTNDHRAKEESFGNSSSTSFNIIRLSATSISKSVDNRMIERNGSFTWTLNFYNGADDEIGGTEMVDVLPKDGDELGSSFAGDYLITGIVIDFSNAPNSYADDNQDMHFYVSSEYSGDGKDLAQGGAPTGTDWTDLMTSASRDGSVITLDTSGNTDMKAFYCDLGDLEPGETIVVRINVQTDGNNPADIYNNLYYEAAEEQDTPVQSNLVTTQVVKRDISGRTWLDMNENGIQDEDEAALSGVTVTLYNGDTQAVDVYGNTVESTKTGDDGSYLFENLPAGTYRVVFETDGTAYDLTVQNAGDDDTVDSDASEVSDENGILIAQITDITLPEIADMDRYLYEDDYNDAGFYGIVNIEGTKTWDDDDNNDGYRPESITIRLLADGVEIDSVTVTEADGWAWSFTDLPKYTDDGIEIHYTITEDAIDHYASEYDGYDVTNTHTLDMTSLTVVKAWDDSGNQDGIRPESVTVRLLADGEDTGRTLELSADNNWTGTFTEIDIYRDEGVRIVYTVEEVDAPDGYEVAITGEQTTGYTVTNTHTPYTIGISGSKTWDDADDQDGIRPDSITVNLLADGTQVDSVTVTPDEDGNWSWSFTDLPQYRDEGVEIVYTIEEEEIDGYTAEVDGYDVTNVHTPETIDVSGSKTWDDSNDQDGVRPNSITVRLYADGEEIESETVKEKDGWSWSFIDLPKYRDGGVEIIYMITEDAVEEYSTTYNGYDITNSYTPEQTSLTVLKTWDDADDQDGIRPESVTVNLLADGENTGKSLVLDASDNWTGSFTELDMNADGKKITYSVEEVSVEGYAAEITGDASSGYVIRNTHEPETASGNPKGTVHNGTGTNGNNPDGSNPNSAGNSKTGDNNMMYLWIVLIIAAAALVVIAVAVRTRRPNRNR